MRIWVDLTNAPHAVVLAPLVRVLERDGHEVLVTARAYGQTVAIAQLAGLAPVVIGRHGGGGRLGKARQLAGRAAALAAWARPQRFHWALAHGSADQPLAARMLGIGQTTMFDYEFAAAQHHVNCRLATRVLVPDAIPPQRLARFGARGAKLVRYAGLKEEYALFDFEPDRSARQQFATADQVLVVLRPPPELALYHRFGNPLFADVLQRLAATPQTRAVILPRTTEQADRLRAEERPGLIVPRQALDARSLIAAADLVVSAGGTMNREAVVLGTPVYTTFAGRLGGVDEQLLRHGRLRQLTRASDLIITRKSGSVAPRLRRDPAGLVRLAVPARGV